METASDQINMGAGNYYFGPGASWIDLHHEQEN